VSRFRSLIVRIRNRLVPPDQRVDDLFDHVSALFSKVAALEEAVAARSPFSEVDRLNLLFTKVAVLEEAVAARSPLSEVDRVDLLFEQVAVRSPLSEVDRVDRLFEQVAALEESVAVRSPLSEVDRVDLLFEKVSTLEALIDGALSERSVEIPWVLRSYRGEHSVVEVGYAFAEFRYLEVLRSLNVPNLVLLDVNEDVERARAAGGAAVVADVRAAPFEDGTVDLVLCISTIEHIGRSNPTYGIADDLGDGRQDIPALREMARWLRPGGRVLLSVPYGRFEDHGWLINYDREHLTSLIAASGLEIANEQYLELAGGWVPRDVHDVVHRGYRSLGAPHAGAVALVELRKEMT